MNIIEKLLWKFVTCRKILNMRQKCSGRQQMTGNELIELIRVLIMAKPKTAIEIGSFCGITSKIIGTHLLSINPSAKLYCIDIFESENSQGEYYKDRYKEDNMKFNYEKCFDDNIKDLTNTIVKIKGFSNKVELPNEFKAEFIFVDGDHSYSAVKSDIERFSPILNVGGFMCFHDVTIGRSGTIKALLDTIWPYPNSDYYSLVSHVDSLLVVSKTAETPEGGFVANLSI